MKAKRGVVIGLVIHIAGWVVAYFNSYMLRNVPNLFDDHAWWGAVVTAMLSVVLVVIGAITCVFSEGYP